MIRLHRAVALTGLIGLASGQPRPCSLGYELKVGLSALLVERSAWPMGDGALKVIPLGLRNLNPIGGIGFSMPATENSTPASENSMAGFENTMAGFENTMAGFEKTMAGTENPTPAAARRAVQNAHSGRFFEFLVKKAVENL